ncbi:MAG TPA: glycosyl hydrolase, partial [Acidobacteriota bacterium]|nr:glycosyl hydrolase [Acidobacteriota bacterium]
PERGSVHSIMEDHENPDLLFVGTEFGVFFTTDGGQKWVRLKGGIPTIAVRDLDIQRREDDLVVGTFGRGIYVLDDYSLLRSVDEEKLQQEATLFPVKNPWMYIQDSPLGGREKSFQGDSFFTAPNPPFGAVISYYLKESVDTKKKTRQEMEKETSKEGGTVSYPTWEELRAEAREEQPAILLSIRDEDGNIVRRLQGKPTAGVYRIAWDLRYPASTPVELGSGSANGRSPQGPLAMPGKYSVTLEKRAANQIVRLAEPQHFEARPLGTATLDEADREALLNFQKKTARLQRAVLGSVRALAEATEQLSHLKQAIVQTPAADQDLYLKARDLENQIKNLQIKLSGDPVRQSHNAPVPPSISGRVRGIVSGHWSTTSAPTKTQLDAYEIAADEFTSVLKLTRTLLTKDLRNLEDEVESAGGPWTPGRVPRWEKE